MDPRAKDVFEQASDIMMGGNGRTTGDVDGDAIQRYEQMRQRDERDLAAWAVMTDAERDEYGDGTSPPRPKPAQFVLSPAVWLGFSRVANRPTATGLIGPSSATNDR